MRSPPRWTKWSRGVRTRGLRVGAVGGPRPLFLSGINIADCQIADCQLQFQNGHAAGRKLAVGNWQLEIARWGCFSEHDESFSSGFLRAEEEAIRRTDPRPHISSIPGGR